MTLSSFDNVPAVVAIPIRFVFITAVLIFFAVAFVVVNIAGGVRWFYDAVVHG